MSSTLPPPTERLTVKAVNALTVKHPNCPVYLQINVKKHPGNGSIPVGNKRVSSPIIIPLPHRARDRKLGEMTVCLIVKDPQQRYKNAFDDEKAPTHELFTEIISISKLRHRVAAAKPKARVTKTVPIHIEQFDLIIAQPSIIHLLPDILPSLLYKTSKSVPVPVQLDFKDEKIGKKVIDPRMVSFQVKKIVNKSTVLVIPKKGSTCYSVLVGNTNPDNMSKLTDNINAAIDEIIEKVEIVGGWENVSSINIKTAESISLPVINIE